jgi:hypothetical protein
MLLPPLLLLLLVLQQRWQQLLRADAGMRALLRLRRLLLLLSCQHWQQCCLHDSCRQQQLPLQLLQQRSLCCAWTLPKCTLAELLQRCLQLCCSWSCRCPWRHQSCSCSRACCSRSYMRQASSTSLQLPLQLQQL